MKRSASDAGLPPAPRQLHPPAIPILNPPAIQPPPPPAPLPPTMATTQRSPVAIWPQPHPAFFTFSSNQANPPGPRDLPATPAPASQDMRVANRPPSGNSSSASLPGSPGRYTRNQVAEQTQLTVKLATPADLSELADTLRQPTKVSKIIIVTCDPQELKGAFDAIRTSLSVLDVEVYFQGQMPEQRVLNNVFSCLHEQQAPIKSFQWVSTEPCMKPQHIDQFIFDALLASQLLEKIHFSVPRGNHAASVIINNPDRLTLCVAKHQSLRSLSFKQIDGSAFIDAILQGVARSPIIEEIHFNQTNLTQNTTALQSSVSNNKQLRSISIKDCQLELGSMSEMLRRIQDHPTLEWLDFRTARIPFEGLRLIGEHMGELRSIGEPIAELLLTNSQIKTLHFRCTLSPANIASLTVGLAANTHLTSLIMDAIQDATSYSTQITTALAHITETNTSKDLENMFEANKGLREIVIALPGSQNGTDNQLLKAIAKCPSIKSLTIENILNIQLVSDVLADIAHIKHLNLKMRAIDIGKRAAFIQTVHQIANNLSQNKNLLNFSLTLHPMADQHKMLRGEFGDLDRAILRIQDITTHNRLRIKNIQAAMGMSIMQELQQHEPRALPILPVEINQMLFEAAIENLSLEDAKRVYEAISPFTPLPGNQ